MVNNKKNKGVGFFFTEFSFSSCSQNSPIFCLPVTFFEKLLSQDERPHFFLLTNFCVCLVLASCKRKRFFFGLPPKRKKKFGFFCKASLKNQGKILRDKKYSASSSKKTKTTQAALVLYVFNRCFAKILPD